MKNLVAQINKGLSNVESPFLSMAEKEQALYALHNCASLAMQNNWRSLYRIIYDLKYYAEQVYMNGLESNRQLLENAKARFDFYKSQL